MNIIEKIDRKPCGCVLTDYEGGRKTYEPCVACGLFRAGYLLSRAATAWPWRRRKHMLEAGNALAAVATTIAKAAGQKAMVDTVVDALSADEEIIQDQPDGDHPGQTGD